MEHEHHQVGEPVGTLEREDHEAPEFLGSFEHGEHEEYQGERPNVLHLLEDPLGGMSNPVEHLGIDAAPKALEPFFQADSKQAVPVMQRSAEDHVEGSLYFGTQTGSIQLFGRRKGRRSVTISIPASYVGPTGTVITPQGIQFAHARGLVDQGSGFQLNVGDSVSLETEGPVFVAVLPGQSSGVVQWIETFDTWGGPVD